MSSNGVILLEIMSVLMSTMSYFSVSFTRKTRFKLRA